MAKTSQQPLQPNPFRTYRDPNTGAWVVVSETSNPFHPSVGQKISSHSKETL